MCGRSRCTLAPESVTAAAGSRHARWIDRQLYQPSHNATPGSWTPVILHHRHAPPHDNRGQQPAPPGQRHPHEDTEVARPDTTPASAPDADGSSLPNKATKADNTEETFCIQTMRWGLVPSFTKQDAKPDPWRMFNARSETADQLASFRRLVPSRRCLVLVNGFYEWKKEGIDGKKQPYYIHLADAEEPMVMAGLWDTWQGPEGPLHTYTILTCDASKRLEWLHDRMPVILRDRASQEEWLTTKRPLESLHKLSKPYNGDDLVWHAVTKAMSNPAFQGPECSQPLQKPSMKAFFQPIAKSKRKREPEENQVEATTTMTQHEDTAGKATERTSPRLKPESVVSPPPSIPAVNADEMPADVAKSESPVSKVQPKDSRKNPNAVEVDATKSPGSGMKRKAGGTGESPVEQKNESAGRKRKAARPPGQPDISVFFRKQS